MSKKNTILKILKLKENKKQGLEIEVKKASEIVDREKSKLKDLEKSYKKTLELFKEKQSVGSLDVNNIKSYHNFFSQINGEINEQKEVCCKYQNELKTLRNSLIDVHKDKKMFEMLDDKVNKKEMRDKELSEQKESDFLSISRKLR